MDKNDSSNLKVSVTFATIGGDFVADTAVSTSISATYTKDLLAGFHAIRYLGPNPSIISSFVFSVQTDPYPCPFPSTSTDIHGTFPGCTPQGTNTGNGALFPCFAVTSSTCTKCYFGYALVGTSCVYNPCKDD